MNQFKSTHEARAPSAENPTDETNKATSPVLDPTHSLMHLPSLFHVPGATGDAARTKRVNWKMIGSSALRNDRVSVIFREQVCADGHDKHRYAASLRAMCPQDGNEDVVATSTNGTFKPCLGLVCKPSLAKLLNLLSTPRQDVGLAVDQVSAKCSCLPGTPNQ